MSEAIDENDKDSRHLQLWLKDAAIAVIRNVDVSLKRLDMKAAANGTFESGARIKDSFQIFEKHLTEFWAVCFAKARSLPKVPSGYELARTKVASVLEGFEGLIPKIVRSVAGDKTPYASVYDATDKLMKQLRDDFERASELAAYEHEAEIDGARPSAPSAAIARLSVNIENWIASCGAQNGKIAWVKFKTHFGDAAPKKIEFENAWRKATGHRGRGRLPKKP